MDIAASTTSSLYGAQAGRQTAVVQKLADAAAHVSDADKARLREKAQDFEAFYISQFMELISPESKAVLNGGEGERMFRHNLNEEIGKNIAAHGGFGVADKVYAELLKVQEASNAATAMAQ